MNRTTISGLTLYTIAMFTPTYAADLPARTALGAITLASPKQVARVETARMDFLPGQSMPAHRHPVPVICFVIKGNLLTRIGDGPEQKAALGSVTYEPAGADVHYFKNASASEPAAINCATLAGAGENTARIMLDEK